MDFRAVLCYNSNRNKGKDVKHGTDSRSLLAQHDF